MKLTVIDTNNWFRIRTEQKSIVSPVRGCFTEAHNMAGNVIAVWDGQNALAARKAIYPGYKERRNKPDDSFYASQDLFRKILEFSKVTQVRVPGFEGDDVIAAIVLKALNDGVPKHNIFIQSNDADMMQLGVPMARGEAKAKPELLALYKTFVGDSSDNIPGAKQFGQKSWEALNEQQIYTLGHIVINGALMTEDEIRGKVEGFYPKSGLEWFLKKENRELLLNFHRIVCFMPVPWSDIEKYSKVGHNMPHLAEPIFQELMI